MSNETVSEIVARIIPADRNAMERARTHWDSVAKPLGSLGLLEDAVIRSAGAMGTEKVNWSKKAVVTFCADNGVVAEGVTQAGQEVTAAVAAAMARGESCVCRMAKSIGAEVFPVDVGVADEVRENGLIRRNVMHGTRNIACGPAMTRGEAVQALMTGVWMAENLAERGYNLLAAGEMGIGNTTTSAAITSVLLAVPVELVTGRGAGLTTQALQKKIQVVKKAIEVNQPDPGDPMDVLTKVGGLDIAAMTGFYLGAAKMGVSVVLDGAISCAAALLAVRLCPHAEKSLIASHVSAEPCGQLLLDALKLKPLITAGLRLGEGTGAVAAMPMLDMGLDIYNTMASFKEIGVDAYEHLN